MRKQRKEHMGTEIVLTVAVAAYNVEQFLEETLNSLVLDCDGLEVLIIDDGSTDNTAEIGKRYEETYPKGFRYIRKENRGWGSVMNMAVRLAKGKYFRQLDGDDFLKTENLPGFLAWLKDSDADLVVTPYEEVDDGSGKIVRIHSWENGENPVTIQNLMERPEFGIWACTFRTQRLQDLGIRLLEHCYYTDVEYLITACLAVERIESWDRVIYRYRTGREGQSVSISGARKNYRQHLKVVWRLCGLFESASEEKKRMVLTRTRLVILQQYRFFFYLSPVKSHKRELQKFDCELKQRSEILYEIPGSPIRWMRRLHFFGYRCAAVWIVWRKRHRRKNV